MARRAEHWWLLPLSTLLLCAPAVYNGFPLVFFDSFDYLAPGHHVFDTLRTGTRYNVYGYRSHFYSLFLALLRANGVLWLVPLVQGLILSYVLLLCFRAVLPSRHGAAFLTGVAALSLTTSASWFVSFVMPDIFAPILILVTFLLARCRQELGRAAVIVLLAIALFSILVHPSHVALTALLAGDLLLVALARRSPPADLMSVAILGGLVGAGVLLTVGMSVLLYGTPGFYRHSPPFLLARSIGDGPGRAFIRDACARHRYAICDVAEDLPTTSSEFLWGQRSVFKIASPPLVRQIKEEELAVVLGAIRAYPLWQLERTSANFARQLVTFDLYSFDGQDAYDAQVAKILRSQRGQYLASRQHARTLPLTALTWIQAAIVWTVLAPALWLACRAWPPGSSRLADFALIVVLGAIGNALVTAPLSAVLGRYQSRVTWLLVALALLLAAAPRNSTMAPARLEAHHDGRDHG